MLILNLPPCFTHRIAEWKSAPNSKQTFIWSPSIRSYIILALIWMSTNYSAQCNYVPVICLLNRQKKRLDCLFSLQKVYRFVLLKNLRILAKMCPRGCDFWLGIENNYLRRQQKDFLFMPDLHRSRQYYGSKVSLFFYFVSETQKFKNYFFFVFTSWAIAPKL